MIRTIPFGSCLICNNHIKNKKRMIHTDIHDEKVNRFEVFESGQIAYLQYEE